MEEEVFIHETAVIDEPCTIGSGSKIWHFSHIMPDSVLGDNCNLGQNVVVSSKVISPAATKAMSLGVITASLVMLNMQRAGLRFPNETPAQIDEYDPPRAAINNVLNEITREVDAIDQHLGNNASDIPNLECN